MLQRLVELAEYTSTDRAARPALPGAARDSGGLFAREVLAAPFTPCPATSADTALCESLAGLSNPHLFKQCAELNDSQKCGPAGTARHMLKLLADRIQHLTGEIDDLNKRIAAGVEANFPGLLNTHGVGPDSAAALCGTSPVEAASGKTQRRRLNRGGDCQANTALYRIVLSRLRWDDRTQDYLRRRIAEGKTRRKIIRCLNRYVAHEIYRLIAPIRTAACPAERNRTAS